MQTGVDEEWRRVTQNGCAALVPQLLLPDVEMDAQAGHVEADVVKAMEGFLRGSAHVVFAWLGSLLQN